ncbi:hypothetical protein WKY82_09340 [Gordonia malaquae]|uniref:hypothetical protein n=1 Tax=Gordonia phage GMA1 TaxID=1647470 RepID=UPI0007B62598|nr:hypothetical protein BH788_gp27 [Gordonia phage GMA1]AKJ72124.1 hypothetical protein GMA1_27 [Gordonia phage GMA1]
MAVSAKLYANFHKSIGNKEVDLDSDAIKVMLCTSSYTPNQGTHQYKSSVTGEVTGTGYTAGGATLASVTAGVTGNVFKFDADDVSWPSSTITARYAVIYDSTPGSDASRPLIGYVDFGADVSTTSGTFQIVWNSSGIFTQTVA